MQVVVRVRSKDPIPETAQLSFVRFVFLRSGTWFFRFLPFEIFWWLLNKILTMVRIAHFRGAPDELVSWASAALFIAYEICIRKPISAKRKLSRELANFCILRTRSVTLVTYSLTYIRSGLQNTKAYVLVCRAISLPYFD